MKFNMCKNLKLKVEISIYFRPQIPKNYLCGHDFSICARDVDPGVEACSVMSLYDISSVDLKTNKTFY